MRGRSIRTLALGAAILLAPLAGWAEEPGSTAASSNPDPDIALSEAPSQADFCARGQWRLDGASSLPDAAGGATFSSAWLPDLEQLAGCMADSAREYACLSVRGSFDERVFSQAVVTAFGSYEAAQAARARGRAAAVLERLSSLGIPASRLREEAPPREPTFRGAEITLIPECLPRPQELSAEQLAVVERAREVLAAPPQQQVIVREVERAPSPSPFFLEVGPQASLNVVEPGSVLSPALRLGLGAKSNRIYGRAGAGMAVASREAQRAGVELSLGGGYELLDWLDLGLVAGWRLGAPELGAPWLERSWFAGAEAVECLFPLGSTAKLCLNQSIHPLGSQTRRARIVDGQLERIDPEEDPLVRFELGVFLRQLL